jgi:diguanylate cyclase (GGDEF)-like protein
LIPAELQNRLEQSGTLPSPPGVATKIIALANDPAAGLDEIAKVLSMDPATSARMLRLANSPMYARHRQSQTLDQALLVLGLNAAISLALSFSLLKTFESEEGENGLDYRLYWRRALIGATAAQVLANSVELRETGELFLTSLIQDIGVMALDRAFPELYLDIGKEQIHEQSLIAREKQELGADHADVGGWLLEKWNFPSLIKDAVANSHLVYRRLPRFADDPFTSVVAFGAACAEVMLEDAGERHFEKLGQHAAESLDMDGERLQELLVEISAQIPDAETVLDMKLLDSRTCDAIQEQAREALVMRSLNAMQEVNTLHHQAQQLEQRTSKLEESTRRDPLTALYNRTFLDDFVNQAFDSSVVKGSPLSVAFADLDKFKLVNDTYGHGAGDQILRATADLLKNHVRSSDVVARYGGEEFVIVFPDTSYKLVKKICERIVDVLRDMRHDVGTKHDLGVTISIGMATHNDGRKFDNAGDLIRAADKALYTAKLQGRDRSVPFDLLEGKAASF